MRTIIRNIISILFGFVILIGGSLFLWKMIQRSTPPPTPKTTVTVIEGMTVTEVNELLRDSGVLVRGNLPQSMEGHLFPDTYEFFLDSTVPVISQKFEKNLENKLNRVGIHLRGEELTELLTMASILEKEIRDPEERRVGAGILWRRIDEGIPLQVDATICYIKEIKPCLPITKDDKKIDSPYNTYLYGGLPPGPIGNPSIDSILAAWKPANSSYWYYISDPDTGETIFAQTLDEHIDNIVKYLGE